MEPVDWRFPYPSQRMPILARNVVATSQPLAAQAGLQMLVRGGNAVDAAVATAIALTVVEPSSNGIGSDAFAILWNGRKLEGINSSGRSPLAWTPSRFGKLETMPKRGWDSVTVPGAVAAWVALSERYGRLPFADLFEPAIRYANDGFMVSPTIARLWNAQVPELSKFQSFADAFMPRGRAPEVGEVFKFPAQARTLACIAETRGDAFYRGPIAEAMVADAMRHGGAMRMDDLASHCVEWVEPLARSYRDYELHELPPNTQGIAALVALGILENFDLQRLGVDSVDSLHLQIEAMKLAFADIHEFVSDVAAMRISPKEMLDAEYLKKRARLIDMKNAQVPAFGKPSSGGTVYLTTADASGTMVSFIQSNYGGFGSGIVVDGVSLQNRGHGFGLKPGHANEVGPGKRPFHTLIPAFVTSKGKPIMSYGVMGAHMQAQGHVQIMSRFADYCQNPQAAADAPRWRIDSGQRIGVEPGFNREILDELKRRGHDIDHADRWATDFGRAQLILKMKEGYLAASERRTDGQAVGF